MTLQLTSCVVASLVVLVQSHAILVEPKARDGMAVGNGIKYVGNVTNYIPDPAFPMCAGFPAAATVATYNAGDKVTIKWDVTIPHTSDPGVTISMQYGTESDFIVLTSGVDDALGATAVTLPMDKSSKAAVLRFMWQSKSDGGFYVGCSDVTVNGPAADAVVSSMVGPTGATAAPASLLTITGAAATSASLTEKSLPAVTPSGDAGGVTSTTMKATAFSKSEAMDIAINIFVSLFAGFVF
ncbi:hypothetical protein BC830DRAFT_1109429 [Chytriomyces sp. MP71]|nr:hypothetical protein BC830DRAFT_1109429 [Chytriomyces sp. MP71]